MQHLAKIAHPAIGYEIAMGRAQEYLIEYPLYIEEYGNGNYYNDPKCADDMPAQLFYMVGKAHLRTGRDDPVFQKAINDTHNEGAKLGAVGGGLLDNRWMLLEVVGGIKCLSKKPASIKVLAGYIRLSLDKIKPSSF
jgi:hypothetical protein